MGADTRVRIVEATSELFGRQGLIGTGLKQIAGAAQAPFGSIYHFFPGGKAQLADEVIRTAGKAYGDRVIAVFEACPDLATAIRAAFAGAAQTLVDTDYADSCPIATIALEVASTDEPLRLATADVFNDWIERGVRQFADTGLPSDVLRRLIIGFITSLEGGFVLSRALRSTEPLEAAARTVRHAVLAELAEDRG